MFGPMQADARIGHGVRAICLAGLIFWAGSITAVWASESPLAPVSTQVAASGSRSIGMPSGDSAPDPRELA